jgi:hypothetical protein
MPDPVPNLLIIPALVLAAEVVELVVAVLDEVAVDVLALAELLLGVVDEVEEDTEVTMDFNQFKNSIGS